MMLEKIKKGLEKKGWNTPVLDSIQSLKEYLEAIASSFDSETAEMKWVDHPFLSDLLEVIIDEE